MSHPVQSLCSSVPAASYCFPHQEQHFQPSLFSTFVVRAEQATETQKKLAETHNPRQGRMKNCAVGCNREERLPCSCCSHPRLASGCHVVLQNHKGTDPTAGRGSYLEAASLFHLIQLSPNVQMRDSHKTNNPGYFLKLIAHEQGERTQLFSFQQFSGPGGQTLPLRG